mgnify:CR=1 FL=1
MVIDKIKRTLEIQYARRLLDIIEKNLGADEETMAALINFSIMSEEYPSIRETIESAGYEEIYERVEKRILGFGINDEVPVIVEPGIISF